MIDRNYPLRTDQDRLYAIGMINANWEALSTTSEPLNVHITQKPENRRNKQNRYYWGGVIKQIAEQAWINGQQFPIDTWHEYFAEKFLPYEEVARKIFRYDIEKNCYIVTPLIKRKSTSGLSVKEFAEYTEQVTAAGAELGVKFFMLEQF
jgi:hypothetical protein